MNKILKKVLSVVLAVTIVLGSAFVGLSGVDFSKAFAVEVSAADDTQLYFTPVDNGYYVAGCENDWVSHITIPDTFEGLPVTGISSQAFENYKYLTSVVIPDGVTYIGYSAFADCSSLTSITIPDSVELIDSYAFNDTAFFADESNRINGAVYANNHLLDVDTSFKGKFTVRNGTKTIAAEAFHSCGYITSIVVTEGVVGIGEDAFYSCCALEEILLPSSLKYISSTCFWLAGDFMETIYVFFGGTEEQWASIGGYDCFDSPGDYEDVLAQPSMHYNSTGHTYGDWVIDKKATVNASGTKHRDCTQCSYKENAKIPQLKCSKPALVSVNNKAGGALVTWKKVTGADSYEIYRKVKGGSWTKVGTAKGTATTFTDSKAKSGTTYYYTVKAKNEAGLSSYNTKGIAIKRLATPALKTVSNTSTGVKFTWGKVTGAGGYTVFRKVKGGSWKAIGKTTGTSYTDKTAKAGTAYYYSVRAYSGDYVSGYNTTGLTVKRLVAPKISSAASLSDGILVKWNKVTGAGGYYVYRKSANGDWKKIATVKGNTKVKYLDETPRKGATYSYRVKAYYSKSTSVYSNTYKATCKY